MKLLRGSKRFPELHAGAVVTIGNFDGVHAGHQALLTLLKKKSDELHLPAVVVLFEPQPLEYFQPQNPPARLSTLREKLDALQQKQIDFVYCLRFDETLVKTQAERFAQRYLFEALNTRYLLVGEDFRFGEQRQGDLNLLKTMSVNHNCVVESFPDFVINHTRVSSTKVRDALAKGELETASQLLGRPYSMCGRVLKGDGRGREWGIPTANLKLNRRSLPLKGVFCVKVKVKGQWCFGVANIGSRPTVDGTKNILEVHLFEFNQSLYGELLQVFFLHKLRDEVKFNSIDELIRQIHHDINTAKAYCLNHNVLTDDIE